MVELMVVMVMMTVVTAFAVPTLRHSLFSDQLKATARRLVGMVSEASQEAVGKQFPTRLTFDFDQNQVMLEIMGKGDDASGAHGPVAKRMVLPDGIKVTDIESVHGGKRGRGTSSIHFSSKGYVDRAFIHLRSDDGRDMTVILSPFIGVARVVDSYLDLAGEAGRY